MESSLEYFFVLLLSLTAQNSENTSCNVMLYENEQTLAYQDFL